MSCWWAPKSACSVTVQPVSAMSESTKLLTSKLAVTWLSHGGHMTVTWWSCDVHGLCLCFPIFPVVAILLYTIYFTTTQLLSAFAQHKETRTIFSLSLLGTLYLSPSLLQVWLPDDDGAQGDLCLGEESWWLAVCSFAYLLDLPTQAIHNVVNSSDLVGNIFCVNINLRMAQWYCTVFAYCTEQSCFWTAQLLIFFYWNMSELISSSHMTVAMNTWGFQ